MTGLILQVGTTTELCFFMLCIEMALVNFYKAVMEFFPLFSQRKCVDFPFQYNIFHINFSKGLSPMDSHGRKKKSEVKASRNLGGVGKESALKRATGCISSHL